VLHRNRPKNRRKLYLRSESHGEQGSCWDLTDSQAHCLGVLGSDAPQTSDKGDRDEIRRLGARERGTARRKPLLRSNVMGKPSYASLQAAWTVNSHTLEKDSGRMRPERARQWSARDLGGLEVEDRQSFRVRRQVLLAWTG